MRFIKINTIDELSKIPIGDWLYDTKLVKRRKLGRHLDTGYEMVPRGFCQLSINDWRDYHTTYKILYLETIDGDEWDGFEPGRYYHVIFKNEIKKIDCVNCIHYDLMYEENPKRIYDGCTLYNTYLKKDDNNYIMPCTLCNGENNINFLDIKKVHKGEK